MKHLLFLCAAGVFLAAAVASGAEYWRWDAASGKPLASLEVQEPDGKAAIYRPAQVSAGNYIDLARIPVNPEQTLTFAAEYRIPQNMREGYFLVRAIFFNEKGVVIRNDSSRTVAQAAGWSEIKAIFAPPADAVSVLLRIINTGVDPVWIRRVNLYDATPEEQEKIGRFAGTLEEKLVLHSHTVGGNPEAVFVMDYKDPAPGDRYSMKVVWDHDEEGFGLVDIGSPMEVPAKGARRLERVEFYLKVTRNTGDLKLIPMVTVGDVNHCPDNVNFGQLDFTREVPATGQWRKFEYTVPEKNNISGGDFLLRLHGRGETTFRLGLPRFYYSDGTVATGFSVWKDPLWQFPDWSEKPFKSRFTGTEGMIMCDTGQATQAGESGRRALLELKKMFPNLANDVIYAITQTLRDRQWYEENNIPVVYQNIPNGLWQLAIAADPNMLCFAPETYRGIKEHLHKFNAAHPGWRNVYAQWAERMKDYGIPEVMSIDCIFQFGGDDSQYEPWYREFLKGRDEGYQFRGETVRRHFADYFETYAGFRPTPKFFGWKSWNDYTITPMSSVWNAGATPEQRRRSWLDTLLRHYAFLMYNNRLGEELGKRGIDYFLMNNGDNWQNGNDWEINARLTGVPGFVEETFFYHPSCVFHSATDAMAFREFYERYDGKHRLIQEDGQGGHGNPYWDVFNTFALVSAMCAATPYHSLQVDWPFESCMETLRGNANDYTLPRYNTFVSMASAYNSQRELGVGEVPESQRRTILFHENTANIAIFSAPHRLGNVLGNGPWFGSNASFNLWDLDYVRDAKVLFNDYYALPVGGAKKLLNWFRAKPGRSLVLTGYTAGKTIDGTYWGAAFGWDQTRLNNPRQFSALIGEIVPEGRRYHASKKPDEVLISDASGKPVLSVYRERDDRKVYYYSPVPGDDPAMDAKAVELIMSSEFGAPEYRKLQGDTRTFTYRYADGGSLFCLFSFEAMDAFKMNDPWIRTANRYNFVQPGVNNRISVRAVPGNYRLYAFMKGELRDVTVPETGEIELPLTGQACELYYLIPADNAGRIEQLQRLQAEWKGKLK